MCGILATINFNSTIASEALELMKHRGPDARGVFEYNNLTLGHLRLSIQDLSEGANQPMFSYDERYVIIFNGEIYNHWDIRKNELKDYEFRTTSDTETILALFIKHKENAVHFLNGIFAFVILDKQENQIFVARDQFGVKPLYFHLSENQFICASELKAMLPYHLNQEIDIDSIQAYLTFMWCPGEGTPFKAIKKLLAGSYMIIDLKDLSTTKIERYFQLKYPNKIIDHKSQDYWVDSLEEKLIKAVERQMLSDAPIGFFLSGGLDSSLLVAMAKKLNPEKKLKCYTIDSGESKDGFASDLYYARKVAAHLDVELVEIKVDSGIVEKFDEIIWYLDEPESDPAPFNAYEIAKAARKDGIKVLIGGTAGDDIFSGYRRHQALIVDQYFDYIPVFLRKIIKNTIQSISSKKAIVRRLKKLTKAIDKSKSERLIGYFEWQDFEFVKNVFKEELQQNLNKDNAYFLTLLDEVKDVEDELNKLLYLEIYTFLIDHNLNYTDKAGMANSVEIRVPYLDLDLVEFSTSIPVKYKMKGKQTKYILRKVAERYLPHDVIYRPKAGFGAPVEYWVRNEMDYFIKDKLSKVNVEKSDIFNYEVINEVITKNNTGKINASYNVWSFLAIESWMKRFKKAIE
ncbi:MAG: asparagine synthase (glutamine-hydrolyzing) [Mongoliitalea sp.]